MITKDKLSHPLQLFYACARKGDPMPMNETDRAIVGIAILRRNIQEAKTHSWLRRTYHRDYVSKPLDEHRNTYCRYINSHEQLGHRVMMVQASYGCDDQGWEYVEPWVLQLPGRDGQEVWIYGYQLSQGENVTVYLDTCDSQEEAERMAKCRAAEYAQQCYEGYLEDQEQQQLQERRERLQELRVAIRATIKALRAMAGDTGLKKALDLLLSERCEVMGEGK